jgi:CheY-like chemotaxis protein
MIAPTPAKTHVGHVLIVDDEDDCNFVTKLVLKKAGYTGKLTCLTSADDALDYLRDKSSEKPDIMFVDINMPKYTGFDLLTMCEHEGLLPNDTTTVIMFSSSNRQVDLDRALSFRCVTGYVEKALTVESFERAVSDHHRHRAL